MNVDYTNLKSGYVLQPDDTFVIHGIKHRVHPDKFCYPCGKEAHGFDAVRTVLGLSQSEWEKMATDCNGGHVPPGSFPMMYSFENLTKFIIALYETKPKKEKVLPTLSTPDEKKHVVTYDMLKRGYVLDCNDTISIHEIVYDVNSGILSGGRPFLVNRENVYDNAAVFDKLGIEDPQEFCKRYGDADNGTFPQMDSFESLTKVVVALFEYDGMKKSAPVQNDVPVMRKRNVMTINL